MNYSETFLTDFYRSAYSKRQLAEILAAFVSNGQQPPLPPEAEIRATRSPGRPTRQERDDSWAQLKNLLAQSFPNQIDLTQLTELTGVTAKTLKGLKHNLEFQAYLGVSLTDYYKTLPEVSKSRLTVVWRAVLDLHNYAQMLKHPTERLPLYRTHLLAWGNPVRPPNQVIQTRDAQERGRVFRLANTLHQAGWSLPRPLEIEHQSEDYACELGCSVNRALVNRTDVNRVDVAREVIGELPWLPTDRTFIEASTVQQAIRQIIGLE